MSFVEEKKARSVATGPRGTTVEQVGLGAFRKEFTSKIQKDLDDCIAQQKEKPKSVNPSTGALTLETSSFTICTRVRPVLEGEKTDTPSNEENFECIFQLPSAPQEPEPCVCFKPKMNLRGKPTVEKEIFQFDKTFGQTSSNDDVYATCRPTIAKAIAGQVGTIFAFGQTGSGKTFTMSSVMDSLASDLFSDDVSSVTGGLKIQVSFSYMEILGQDARDCLCENDSNPIQIGELLDGQICVKNLSTHAARSKDEFLALIGLAKAARSTAATDRNAASSRSHGVGMEDGSPSTAGLCPGMLYIIDLAGSERMADSVHHSDARLAETKAINLGLMSLKECIRARSLASTPGKGDTHVPFRRSKLTLLMKDCFDIACPRICSTVIIAHVTPLARDIGHSLNTLKYAAPLKLAVAADAVSGKRIQKDLRDPAGWSREQTAAWIVKMIHSKYGSEGQVITQEEEEEEKEDHGKENSNTNAIVDALQPANMTHAGLYLCQMTEIVLLRTVQSAGGSAELAKMMHSELWTLICDAKMRKRRPNGTIITPEEEAAEAEKAKQDVLAKAALWAEREAHMKTDF